ncbi:hypothetical protein ACR77J_18750 [Tissierella praeacuta]|uniref:hypothetical protein n=1 Tax=Tissierella praeacuta TaxID=43131 RepID=UPI003DA6446F
MKRLVYIVGIIGVLVTINGCSPKLDKSKFLGSEKAKIGIVETIATEYNSSIHWYDKDLNKVSEQKLKYAMLGSSFHNPVYYDNKVFMIPQGLGNKKDSKKVISLDKNNFEITEYSFNNIALNDVAVSEDYIYTINTLNGNTHISRLDKKNNEIKEIIVDKEYFSGITILKGKIYAFSSNMLTTFPRFYLYIYNEELDILDKKDITQYGTGQYKFMYDEKYLYAGVTSTKEDKPANSILKVSIDTNAVEIIDIGEEFPNDILQYNNKIIITNHDLVTYEGSKITILDKNTQELEIVELNRKAEFAGVIGNSLVVADQESVSLYNIENKFKLIKDIFIEKHEDSYISSIIILE